MDIEKNFTRSFNELKRHKVIILPIMLSLLLPLIMIYSYYYISGLQNIVSDLSYLTNQYENERQDFLVNNFNLNDKSYTKELASYLSNNKQKDDAFMQYLDEKGFDWDRFNQLINTKNIVSLIFLIIAITCISLYFSIASYTLIALNINNKKLSLENTVRYTNKFILKFFTLRVMVFTIFLAPITAIALITVSFFFINVLLGGLSILIGIILIIGYMLFIGMRLFFILPVMFIEDRTAVGSIKESYHLTRYNIKQVFFAFGIIYGITIFTNSIAGSPLFESIIDLGTAENAIKTIIAVLILALFLVLESIMLAFENLFLFYSYIDFKELAND